MFNKKPPKQWYDDPDEIVKEPESEEVIYWRVTVYFKGSKDSAFYYDFYDEHSLKTFMRQVREGTGWHIDADYSGSFRYEEVSRMFVNTYRKTVTNV